MNQRRTLVFIVLATAVLVLSAGSARADMCFGHPPYQPYQGGSAGAGGADAGADADAGNGGHAQNDKVPRRTGSAFFIVAAISGVLLVARRKAADQK